jgi:gamma-glutamyltranspeptidase/glutathione hydrolase
VLEVLHCRFRDWRSVSAVVLTLVSACFILSRQSLAAPYVGSTSVNGHIISIESAGNEVLGNGGGSGTFSYKGGGNAVDALVAAALAACVVNSGNCSLGGYGGHMLIWNSGLDGSPQGISCIDFGSDAGSLASSNMFVGNIDPVTGTWTGAGRPANQYGWQAAGVPGTFAGLYMAQTNFGRKVNGTNFFPFAEILKPALARIANGQATGNAYYSISSLSNTVMDLYTNSPGYKDGNGNPNPLSSNDPYGVFYSGDIAQDIVAAMQAYGGLVTYPDMTNYRPRQIIPYVRHFSPLNGTPARVYVAPPGSSGLSVLQELAIMDALGWTNGPAGTWDSLHYWHSRAEVARLMWKDHFQWIGDPWSAVLPPDFLGNGSTNFCDQLLAHATNGYVFTPPWDTTEIPLTNSLAGTITDAVNGQTNVPILVHWNDIRYGTCNITTCDQWGNCVAMTFSMGGGFGAQVGVTNRGLVLGQGMALFDTRPGWPNSIAPGKRQVDNMCPAIVIPDYPVSPTNGSIGGRPPFAIGGVGGSTIENNVAMCLIKYITDSPWSPVSDPLNWLLNFEGNNIIYMRPSYPAGVQTYLASVGFSAPGGPPSTGDFSYVQGWVPPLIVTQPQSTNANMHGTVTFDVAATGMPLFYQWYRNGVPLADGGLIGGVNTPHLTVASVTSGAVYSVTVTNGGLSLTSAPAALTINGAPVIISQPSNSTNIIGTLATFYANETGSTPLTFRWLKNGAPFSDGNNISGATTTQLNVDSVLSSDSGSYSLWVTNSAGSVTSSVATLNVISPTPFLAPLWSVGPNDAQLWFNLSASTGIPNQRTIAYNSFSNHLYVVSRSSSTTSNFVIYVLNATNGSVLYTLNTNGIQCNVGKGGIGVVGIAVADDGAIYACNTAPDAEGAGGSDPSSLFRVYRWANANSGTTPRLIYSGDPSGTTSQLRWGDNLFARGAGTNTLLLVDSTFFSVTPASYSNGLAAILYPTNAFMTNFTARWFITTNYSTTVGRSLEFDQTNNAMWQKGPDRTLSKATFNPSISLGGTRISSTNVLALTNFPVGLMGVGLDLTRNLAAGVFSNSTSTADTLNLYDISNPSSPLLIWATNFPISPRVANGNQISQTFFKNDLVFTIDANNGIMVSRIQTPTPIIRLTNVKKLPNGSFQFGYANADTSRVYSVYASSNLLNWSSIGSATQASMNFYQFTDSPAPGAPVRFYQVRSP